MKNNHAFFVVIGIFSVTVIWFLGALSFQYSCPILAGIFGPTDNLENTFAPVGAFFSAMASFGALYAIYLQFKNFQEQQYENTFMLMMQAHRSNRDSMSMDEIHKKSHQHIKKCTGIDCFREMFFQYNAIAYSFGIATDFESKEKYFPSTLEQLCTEKKSQFIDDCGKIDLSRDESLKIVDEIFDEFTNYRTTHYFWHLYHTLKYINTHIKTNKKHYIATLRAQLSTYEMLLLYYHGLASQDLTEHNGGNVSKYKKLIEDTSFLHGIRHELLFSSEEDYLNTAFSTNRVNN